MSVKKYLDKLEDLTGQKIIVTGGTSGIGLSIVKELLIKGADVVILARNLTKANEVKTSLQNIITKIDFVKNASNNNKKNSKKGPIFLCKPLAICRCFCYYIKAFRTGADFPHVAVFRKRLGGRAEAPGGIKQKKENIKWQSYP